MSEQNEPQRAPRRVFIDVLRLLAAVQMIQGHSIDAVLGADQRRGAGYAAWSFARGLTSVTFLVTAGLAFVLAEARGDAAGRRRRRRRALLLLVIGYAMHAPLGVLVGVPLVKALHGAMVVDVLQCIGVSLLALELLSLRVQGLGARVLLGLGLCAGCFLSAPLTHGVSFAGPARLLGNYVTTADGSLFPLVPWAGYVLAGFAVGTLALRPAQGGARVLAAAALACGGLALASGRLEPPLPAAVSPSYCLLKLACVLGLAAGLMGVCAGLARLPSLLTRLAAETLFLYVSHVVILYADGIGLARQLAPVHGWGFGAALALALLVVCGVGALAAPRLFRTLRREARGGTRGATP